jgi:C4-dicarboxylate-specific signal transduction histidine kinase
MGEERSVTVLPATGEYSAIIRATLGAPAGDIALVTLPYAADRFYLVCRGRPAIGLREQGLAERFSLLLQQALTLHDDQERIVHAAKLSALGQMATSIAHELRQPLNTISIAAQNVAMLLERDAVTPELLREKTDRILKQVERACRVMDRMRRFGRKSSSDYKSVPLLQVIGSARSLMDAVSERMGITIDIDVPDELDVLADELELEQVLVNLLQNARDAIEGESSPVRRIRVWSAIDPADNEQVRLHVQDSGPGFAPEALGHALDAFFTTKPAGQGTGLGLSICHAILREHGGRLQVGNAEDGGALITLFLRRPAPARAKIVTIGRHRTDAS